MTATCSTATETCGIDNHIVPRWLGAIPFKGAAMATQNVAACPRCNQSDAVWKVSSIVTDGAYGIGNWNLAFSEGQAKSTLVSPSPQSPELLAQRLTPPSSQEIFTFVRYRYRFSLPKLVLLAAFGLLALLSIVAALLWPGRVTAFILGTLLLSVLCAGFLYWVLARRRSRYDLEVVTLRERVQTNWAKLYYCARDDIVFNPDTARWAEVSRMRELLV